MNANEVIANRALEIIGRPRGGKEIHPNDHVNMGQSSNDVIPTAIHLAALSLIERELRPALQELRQALQKKATALVLSLTKTKPLPSQKTSITLSIAGRTPVRRVSPIPHQGT